MKRKDDPKVQVVQWFLRFISDDFEKMSQLDFAKRVIEAQHYFVGPKPQWLSILRGEFREKEGLYVPFSFKRDPKEVRDWLPIPVSPWPKDFPWKEYLPRIQKILKDYLEKQIKAENQLSKVGKAERWFGLVNGKFRIIYERQDHFHDLGHDFAKLAMVVVESLILAFDEIPGDAIKLCQECGKYFLHLSKKPKYFCSTKCTTKAISRRRREKDPEGYKKKQRKIMRKKYEKERAKKVDRSPKRGG